MIDFEDDTRGPDEGDGFDTRETPETRSETPFRCDSEQYEDEDYSGDDPYRPCRDSGAPCLEEILSWQRIK